MKKTGVYDTIIGHILDTGCTMSEKDPKRRSRLTHMSVEDIIERVYWFFSESIWGKPTLALILATLLIGAAAYARYGAQNPFDPALHPDVVVDPTAVPTATIPPPTAIPVGEGTAITLQQGVLTDTIIYVCPPQNGQQQQLSYSLQLVSGGSGTQVRAITGVADRYTPAPDPVPDQGIDILLRESCDGMEEHPVGKLIPGNQFIPFNVAK